MKVIPISDPRVVDGAVLNKTLLDQYRVRKNNLLERLINAYLEEAPRFLEGLKDAVEARNLPEMRTSAHALKSCSLNLGAMRLAKVCQEIETAVAHGNETEAFQAASRIGIECFEAEQALRSELFHLKQTQIAS